MVRKVVICAIRIYTGAMVGKYLGMYIANSLYLLPVPTCVCTYNNAWILCNSEDKPRSCIETRRKTGRMSDGLGAGSLLSVSIVEVFHVIVRWKLFVQLPERKCRAHVAVSSLGFLPNFFSNRHLTSKYREVGIPLWSSTSHFILPFIGTKLALNLHWVI